ncbi:50S ribosomal protein L30 [Ligilactobacillus salitolerans]|uniref:Large ribosomal subunit protein uL30 n=1 Tax=Ligilactobacillus salitolerans TaxID=1808352 RepID=A0A401IUY9_9LACO|nr:50S ribosomal protein L30 [Ligilactobacillus salitolerans]GBG95361.1 50S ribosomal protein L30 [Ligilactobacillus salitolerans]
MANIKVTLTRSVIGRPQNQREIVKGLGLTHINSFAIVPDNAAMRGAIRKINHLVDVEEAE